MQAWSIVQCACSHEHRCQLSAHGAALQATRSTVGRPWLEAERYLMSDLWMASTSYRESPQSALPFTSEAFPSFLCKSQGCLLPPSSLDPAPEQKPDSRTTRVWLCDADRVPRAGQITVGIVSIGLWFPINVWTWGDTGHRALISQPLSSPATGQHLHKATASPLQNTSTGPLQKQISALSPCSSEGREPMLCA